MHDFSYAGLEVLPIRIGKVVASDRFADDQVSSDEGFFGFEVVHHVSGGMAGRVDDPAGQVSDGQDLTVMDISAGPTGWNRKRQGEESGVGILEFGFIERVDQNGGCGESVRDPSVIGYMVEVSVGKPQSVERPPLIFDLVENGVGGVIGGIEKDALSGGFIDEQIAVGSGQSAGIEKDFHTRSVGIGLRFCYKLSGVTCRTGMCRYSNRLRMTETDSRHVSAPIVAFAGWVIPGLGYYLIGQKKRSYISGIAIILTFWLGIWIGGIRVIDVPGYDQNGQPRLDRQGRWLLKQSFAGEVMYKPWYIAQSLNGPMNFLATWVSLDQAQKGVRMSTARIFDIGTLYTAIAGMLNLLVIIDSAYRASHPYKPQHGPDVQTGKEGAQ